MSNPIHGDQPLDQDRDGLAKLFGLNNNPLAADELARLIRASAANSFSSIDTVHVVRVGETVIFTFKDQVFYVIIQERN